MDVSSILEIQPAPQAVFSRLATHRDRPRFQVRDKAGTWQPVTWGQFATQIRAVARWLIEHDLQPGERIAIYANNSVAWASTALGAQTAGGLFVPIYPASTPDQVAYILDHAEIKYVFVAGSEPVSRLAKARSGLAHPPTIVDLADMTWAAEAAARDLAEPALVDARLAAVDLDQPAEMLYTSGTSATPRACRSPIVTSAATAPIGSSRTRRSSPRTTWISCGCR